MAKKRILSGMRPTGPLHLGNLHGALANWKSMQDDYECFFFIADWHALTTDYDATTPIEGYILDVFLDWLSVGLSPERSTLFVQSHIKEHAELFLLLSMITPLPWLERNPTYKEQIAQLKNRDLSNFGFLGYPVLQAADIIMPDLARAGGILEMKKIAAMADTYYIPVAPHNMAGPLATIASAHLCACIPNFMILEYQMGDVPWSFGEDIDLAVYRMVQEGLTNAFNHGKATQIKIQFWRDRPGIGINIHDNGFGSKEMKEGIGMSGMKERIEQLGGWIRSGSTADGFELSAWFPWSAASS